jgi:bifunctional DNA-binding transcriptional regulator/antitoxin component of YhaV-PrlF toxin-antitoxin module
MFFYEEIDMGNATVSSKYLVTIPQVVRVRAQIKPGDRNGARRTGN